MEKEWSLAEIWNGCLNQVEDEPLKARSYLHASELGGSFVDIFYRMKATPYTNKFSAVNMRKMEIGKLMEGIVRFVLKRAGLLKVAQENVDYQIPGMLETHGRLDFVAGGQVDLKQAESTVAFIKLLYEELGWPERYLTIADNTLEYARKLAGKDNRNVLALYVMEIKSVGDFVYRMLEAAARPMNFHHLQGFHYLIGKGMKKAKIEYVSREDGRLMEKTIINGKESYQEYQTWIGQMTDYYKTGKQPPLEPLILFNEDSCSFNKNTVGVEWSKYLTMLYGFENPEAYRNYTIPKVEAWNRVFKRCVGCMTMTQANKDYITEAKKLFPDWDRLVDLGKLKGVLREENQEAA